MGRIILIAALIAMVALSTVTALPKPPKVLTFAGSCGGTDPKICMMDVPSTDFPDGSSAYVTAVATLPHELALADTILGGGLSTESYVVRNGTSYTSGFVIPYCSVKDAATKGLHFTIGCKQFDKSTLNPFIECPDGAASAFTYQVTVVIRQQYMGSAGIDAPAVAELPYIAGDLVVLDSITFHTPTSLPPGGWSLVVTLNRVDWNEDDHLIDPRYKDNLIGLTVAPYTAARAAQCLPNLVDLPVPLYRLTPGAVAGSVNNGFLDSSNKYGGFEITANTEYEVIFYAPYTTQGIVITASLAPHTVTGDGSDHNLVYSHGSMAAGVILSLLFGGAIGAYIVHWRNQKRVQTGFNTAVDESSHINRINQIDA